MKILFFAFLISISMVSYAQNIPMYVGTYTGEDSEGIYCYDFNTKTGELNNKTLVAKIENPSFLTFSSNKKFLYSVSEINSFDTNSSGVVNAFSVAKNGSLQLLNKVSSNGAHPCHISLNNESNKIAVSNYSGGNISIHNIKNNGEIQPANQIINHNITSKKSHAHSAKFYKNNLFVADLGRDFLAHYSKNKEGYSLQENYNMIAGAGPRHFEISTKGKFIYILNELNSTVSVLQKNKKTYNNIQNISTLNTNYIGKNKCADIHLSKNERFLYASNRGENSIVIFKIAKKTGLLQKIQSVSVEGDWPRNFTLSPNGNYLLVANKKSKNISVYSVNKISGKLTFKYKIKAPTPVCLLF